MRAHGILKGVPAELYDRIACQRKISRFPAKQLLFFEGNPCDSLTSVRKGLVKISKQAENGKTQILGIAGPGCLLGFEVFLAKPFQSTAETLTPVELCLTTRQEFDSLIQSYPDVAKGLIGFLSQRIFDLGEHILRLGTLSARQRVAAYLLSLNDSASSYGAIDPESIVLSRQEIADTLGMAKETLIRLLTQLAKNKAVTLDGPEVRILDPRKLERQLSSLS